ncbi:MAG: QueT transporter family protein [Clostridia bacterium]|nr:QueT transporter family protein [Clostridia bacterium]
MKTKDLVTGALIAGAYLALTLVLAPISYGPIQFRVSEALTLLPLIFPQAVPGLFIGCLLANVFGGYGAIDIVCGSAATLAAAIVTRYIGTHITARAPRLVLGALPPVLFNAVVIGAMLTFVELGVFDPALFAINGTQILISQAGVVYVIGIPLVIALQKANQKYAFAK